MSLNKRNMKFARTYLSGMFETATAKVIAMELVELGFVDSAVNVTNTKHARQVLESFYRTKHKPKTKKRKTRKRKDTFLTSWEWTTLRYKVLQIFGRRCMCCGATPDDGHTVINVDHIKPRHTHPELKLEITNLQVLCHLCNKGKGAWDTTDFR